MPQTFSTPTRRLLILCGALAIAATAAPAHAQPTLSKVFTPDTIGPGSVSTITFTITNGSASPVTGLSFTDTLPTVPGDVDIADPANASTTCDLGVSGSLTAPDGGGTITLSDAQIGGSSSCTVTVDVTANTAGVHTNPAITLSSSAGSSMSLPIDLTVDTDLPGFSKSFAPSSVALGEKSTLTFLIDNTANASNVDNLDFTDNLPAGMEIADPANASTTCGTATIPPTLTAAAGTSVIILDADGIGSFPAVEDGTTCTVTVDVVTTGAGELDNVTSELLADFVSAGKASDTLEVTVTALAIQKEFTDDPVPPGGTATLELRIDNFDRDFPATGVAFTDDLTTLVPALPGLTFTGVLFDDCLGTTSIGGGGTILSLSGGTIAAEGFCTIRVSLSVPAGATPGSYTNTTGTVSATVDGSPVVGNTASDDLFVEPVPLLTKEFLEVGTFNPDPVVNPGDDVILQFTVTNTSTTSAATDVAFDDELTDAGPGTGFLPFPISVTLPPVPDPPCGGGSSLTLYSPDTDRQGLRLTGGSLTAAPGAGATCSFYVTLTIPVDLGPGIYTNTTEEPTATVDAATRTGEVASDTLTVVAAPSLSKEFTDDPVAPGGTVTLELTLSYSPDASGDATGITFTDDVGGATGTLPGLAAAAGELPMIGLCPAGDGMLSGSAGDTLLTFSGATLMPGEECTFSVTLDVPAGAAPGTYPNATSGVAATVDGVAATSAPAEDDLKVAGLVFTKEFLGDPVIAGDTVTLRFTIDNVHPTDDADIILFTDNLGDGGGTLSGLAATGPPSVNTCGGTLSGTTSLTYLGGAGSPDVASEDDCTIEVELLVPAGAADGTYNNTTSSLIASQGGVVIIDPAVDDLTVNSNLLQLSKAFIDDPVAPGDTVTLELTLTNLDTSAASMIDFTDDFGTELPGVTFDSEDFNDCGAAVAGLGTDMISVTGASLGIGGTCALRFTLTVPPGADAGIYTNTTSDVSGDIGGFAVTGDAASDDLEVIQLLLFSKSFDGPTTATGTAMLTFTITNPGTDTASDIAFTDNLDDVISGLIATSLPAVPCGAGSEITGIGFLTFSGGELPPMGGMCSFAVEVLVPASATAGTYPNITSDLFQAGLEVADPATADLVIEPPPTFAKVFSPDAILAGGTSTLTFTIDNSASALAASSLDFTDNLPAGVVVATPSNASTTCTGGTITALSGSGTISYSGGSVAAGAMCTIDVDVTSIATGAHVNVTGDLTSTSGNSGTATDTLTVSPAADLSVTKTDGVTSATPGGSVTYTITVTNPGPSADPSVGLSDVFPSPPLTCTYTSVAAGGATGNTAAGAGDIADTLSMPAGSSVTYTADCDIDSDATGTLSNTATITPSITDTVPGNNSATDGDTVLEPEADLGITKTDGVTTAIPGQTTLTYTIVASNAGLSDDPSVSVADAFPASLTCTYTSVAGGGATGNTAAGAGDIADTLSMPAGSSVTYTADCDIDAGATGTLSNTATVSGSVTDPDPGDNSATDDDTVLAPEVDLAVTKTDGVTAATPGESVTYTIVVSNSGPSDDPSVSVADAFPAELTCTYTSVAAGGATGNTAAGAGDIADTLSMPAGSSVTYTADCAIDAGATGTLSNTATVTGSVTDTVPGNNSATDDDTVLTPEADLEVTKTDGVTTATPGESVTYTIVVSNDGASDDPSVSVTDTFPAELTCTYTSVAAGGATGNTAAGAGDIADTLSMPAGSSVTYTADCTIAEDATGTLSNTATVAGSVTDPDPGNNSATDDDTVLVPDADLGVVKEGPATVTVGEQLTYTLTITNDGPSTATMVSVDDPTPTGLTFISATAPCAGGFPCDLGTMSAGDQIIVDVTFEVPFDYAGPDPIVNTATVSSDVADGVPGNDSDTAETDVVFDVVPPEVTGVATNAGPLAECDTVREPVTVIEVTIEDDQSPIENAGAASSYLLVEAGPDRDFSTADCTGPAGDDAQVTIASVTLIDTPPTALAQLNFGAVGLGAGLYRLLVCDAITDAAGNALDGDGDAAPGGDFVLSFFRADPLNLFENGHFDDCPVTLDPWLIVATAPNTVTPGTPEADDHEASPLSASARVSHSTAAPSTLAQCVDVEVGVVYDLSARWRFDPPMGAQGLLEQTCEFFDAAACTGVSLGSTSTATFLEDSGGAWEMIAGEVVAAAGAVSALCDYAVQPAGLDPNFDLYLDALSLTTDGLSSIIFADGFESGDTSAWSSTQP